MLFALYSHIHFLQQKHLTLNFRDSTHKHIFKKIKYICKRRKLSITAFFFSDSHNRNSISDGRNSLPKSVFYARAQQSMEHKSVQFKALKNRMKNKFNGITRCGSFNNEDTQSNQWTNPCLQDLKLRMVFIFLEVLEKRR